MYQLLIPELKTFTNTFPFDPTYGYNFEQLQQMSYPKATEEFIQFWKQTYHQNQQQPLQIKIEDTQKIYKNFKVKKISYQSWEQATIGAWVLEPQETITKGLVIGHGYGGRADYNIALTPPHTVIILPVIRGFHISTSELYPNTSSMHVIHKIEDKENYILRGCVADLWSAVSCMYELYPQIQTCGYSGSSFGGGLGALMLPFEKRIHRAHLSVPTFGNHPLRVTIPCNGSGQSVRDYYLKKPEILTNVLAYYDAAAAASLIQIPMLLSPALYDPSVPPPSQFSVVNAVPSEKQVWVFQTGHFDIDISNQEDHIFNHLAMAFFQK